MIKNFIVSDINTILSNIVLGHDVLKSFNLILTEKKKKEYDTINDIKY